MDPRYLLKKIQFYLGTLVGIYLKANMNQIVKEKMDTRTVDWHVWLVHSSGRHRSGRRHWLAKVVAEVRKILGE